MSKQKKSETPVDAATTCSPLGFCPEAAEALLRLGAIQAVVAEVFELDKTPITEDEIRDVCERHAGSGIHTCSPRCQRPACVARRERNEARHLAEYWRNAAGPEWPKDKAFPWENDKILPQPEQSTSPNRP